MMPKSLFKNQLPYTLRTCPFAPAVENVLQAALEAVNPYSAVQRALSLQGCLLSIVHHQLDLSFFRHIYAIAIGKAASPMLQACADVLGSHLSQALLITKSGHVQQTNAIPQLAVYEAAHPIPDERSVRAAQAVKRLLNQTQANDLVLFLISGGGSALLTHPADGITLTDLQLLTDQLLKCGASIHQLNTLRKHLDEVKGGGLAAWAFPACSVSLILSDVVGNPLDVIASGPTVADPTTFQDALNILSQFDLCDKIPPSILQYLKQGTQGLIPETLKPNDPRLSAAQNFIIASNEHAARAACSQAQKQDFHPLLLTTFAEGEARHVGSLLAAIARQINLSNEPLPRPACVVIGGETTVTVRGNGLGGRNQELALGAVKGLAGLKDTLLLTLATDGGDGPTDAAGSVVSGDTLTRAAALSLNSEDFLQRNDSYHFFASLEDLIITGPTFTNVNDLAFLFAN